MAAAPADGAGAWTGPGVYVHEAFLPRGLCSRLLAHAASAAGEPAAVQPARGGALTVSHAVRRAWEVELPDDLHDLVIDRINAVREELAACFGVPLDPCDAVAVLRYPPGAFYRTHRDTGRGPGALGLHRRAVSIVIFLNTGSPHPAADFTGGHLRLHEMTNAPGGLCDIAPAAGTLVAFRSGRLHEVLAVQSGTRVSIVTWLLRSAEADRGEHGRPTSPGVSKRG